MGGAVSPSGLPPRGRASSRRRQLLGLLEGCTILFKRYSRVHNWVKASCNYFLLICKTEGRTYSRTAAWTEHGGAANLTKVSSGSVSVECKLGKKPDRPPRRLFAQSFKAHRLQVEIEIMYENVDVTVFFKKFLIFSLRGGDY